MLDFAILCPGQGSQTPTMFDRLVVDAESRAVVAEFSSAAGMDLVDRARRADRLFDNDFAQPALVAAACATWALLAPHLPAPALFGGYSVGELSAWACAEAWSIPDVARIVVCRAAAMDRNGPSGCGMLAVRGVSREVVVACAPDVDIAIVNAEDHMVLAGPVERLERAANTLAALGAITQSLDVRVPSHTRAMRAAAAEFGSALASWPAARVPIPVLRGIDGGLVFGGAEAARAITDAIATTVRWDACRQTLVERGIRSALELGPGRSLTRIGMSGHADLQVRSVDDFRTIEGAIDWQLRQIGE